METTLPSPYLLQLPVFLVWLVGIAVALKQRQRRPAVTRTILFALSMLLLSHGLGIYVGGRLIETARELGLRAQEFGAMITAVSIVLLLVTAAAWHLVLRAALAGRTRGMRQ